MLRLQQLPRCPRRRARPYRITGRATVLALLAPLLLGCGSQDSVQHYRIPKRELLYAANHVPKGKKEPAVERRLQPTQPTDRMLGAIVPRGARTWYFKMTGPMEAVASQEAAFRALIESLRFDSEQSPPQWTLPESWKESAGTGLRLATLTVDVNGQPLEVSVMPLATSPSANSLLDNVNRWRGQMRLPPITESQLPDDTVTLNLAGGQATLVNLLGNFISGAMGSGAMGSGAMGSGAMGSGAMGSGVPGHGDAQPADEPAGQEQ